MITIIEVDTRRRNGKRWSWHPIIFRGQWDGKRMWRFGWGIWSISRYPAPGLREFFDHVESDTAEWRN